MRVVGWAAASLASLLGNLRILWASMLSELGLDTLSTASFREYAVMMKCPVGRCFGLGCFQGVLCPQLEGFTIAFGLCNVDLTCTVFRSRHPSLQH